MKKLYFLVLLINSLQFTAQSLDAFSKDTNYNQLNLPFNHYFNNFSVKKNVVLPDGKILLLDAKKIIKLNIDNTLDTTFNTGSGFEISSYSNSTVNLSDFCVQADGKILVLGKFQKYNNNSVSNLIRLNTDGSLDTTFNFLSSNLWSQDNASVALQSDGKIMLLFDFGNNYILKRLNSNGSIDNSFEQPLNMKIGYIKILSDGKFLVASNSASDSSSSYYYANTVYRLNSNGTLDQTFQSTTFNKRSSNSDFCIKKIEINGQYIYVGGDFTKTINNVFTQCFARLLLDGTLDESYNIGMGFRIINIPYSYSKVTDFEFQPDGKIIVCGHFNKYFESDFVTKNAYNIIRLNTDGTIDSTFLIADFFDTSYISSISLLNNGHIFASGYGIGDGNRERAEGIFSVIFNQDGTRDYSFNNISKDFFSGIVSDIIEDNNGKIYMCGSFHLYNGELKRFFIKLNEDGTIDNSMNYGLGVGFKNKDNRTVDLIRINSTNDKLYLSGDISNYNNTTVKQIIKLNIDGSLDNSFNIYGSGFSSTIKTILPLENNRLLVGGSFTSYNGSTKKGSGYLNSTGQTFIRFPCGSDVRCSVLQSDGKVLIGGVNNTEDQFRGLSRFNGSNLMIDNTFNLDSQITGATVDRVSFTNSNKIIIVGDFFVNGVNKKILRINNDGSIDTTFNYIIPNSNVSISDLQVANDDKLIIIKKFTGNPTTYELERLNANGVIDTSINSRNLLSSGFKSVKVLSDGGIYLYNIYYGSDYYYEYDNSEVYGIAKLIGEDYYRISGLNKFDYNNNGCDVSDINYPNLKFSIFEGSILNDYITNQSGNYSIPVQSGNYTILPVLENPTYFNISPTSFVANFPTQASPLVQDFCVTPNGVHHDVEVTIITTNSARPGFDANYTIVYKNKGNQFENGAVTLDFNDAVLDLVSANPSFSSQATNSLTFNYTNLQPFETRTINLVFNVNSPTETPAVNNGDVLNYTASITPLTTDELVSDNTSTLNQTVVGSYDPNDKTCIEGTTVGSDIIGQYVHYVIRFENTGTYAAENVVVKDMIDLTKFDVSTLIPLHSSHDFVTRINGNKVEFIFEGINLPFDDANNDGYVAFKIKTKSNLVVGDTFSNDANIYFDYNFPITTNTFTTTIAALKVTDFDFGTHFTLYPNPVKDVLSFQSKGNMTINSIEIYNTLGQIVLAVPNANSIVDVSGLQSGNYFVKVNTDLGISNTKFIKE
jgi:uncharacterized delta-60 repeat protein